MYRPRQAPSRCGLALALALTAGVAGVSAAEAQQAPPDASTYAAAFAGDWLIFDDRYAANGTPCKIHLKAEGSPFQVTAQNCRASLAGVTSWRIEAGQLHLLAAANLFARLGGTTARVSGWDSASEPLVLDRDAGPVLADPVSYARKTKGCWFVGYSSECANPAQALRPAGKKARICTVVDLKLRGEARPETAAVGVLPAQTCIGTEVCVDTATGPWCYIRFDTAAGWVRQHALRQGEWPVLTFVVDDRAS